jgi:hypothetical protein
MIADLHLFDGSHRAIKHQDRVTFSVAARGQDDARVIVARAEVFIHSVFGFMLVGTQAKHHASRMRTRVLPPAMGSPLVTSRRIIWLSSA